MPTDCQEERAEKHVYIGNYPCDEAEKPAKGKKGGAKKKGGKKHKSTA